MAARLTCRLPRELRNVIYTYLLQLASADSADGIVRYRIEPERFNPKKARYCHTISLKEFPHYFDSTFVGEQFSKELAEVF